MTWLTSGGFVCKEQETLDCHTLVPSNDLGHTYYSNTPAFLHYA